MRCAARGFATAEPLHGSSSVPPAHPARRRRRQPGTAAEQLSSTQVTRPSGVGKGLPRRLLSRGAEEAPPGAPRLPAVDARWRRVGGGPAKFHGALLAAGRGRTAPPTRPGSFANAAAASRTRVGVRLRRGLCCAFRSLAVNYTRRLRSSHHPSHSKSRWSPREGRDRSADRSRPWVAADRWRPRRARSKRGLHPHWSDDHTLVDMGGVSRTNHAECGETASDKTHCARRQLRMSGVPVVDAMSAVVAGAALSPDDEPHEERARVASGSRETISSISLSSSRSSATERHFSTALMQPSTRLWDDCGR